MTKEQILQEAMALPAAERDELAQTLWQSTTPDELSPEQSAELHRRIEAKDIHELPPIPRDQVMRLVRERRRPE